MRCRLCLLFALVLPVAVSAAPASPDSLSWPEPTQTNRPWTRWWWLGSAVDAPNLQRLLGLYHEAGMGGVEICPIYGAKGYESRFIRYLSPEWMEMLGVTTTEAKRLGMGVDMTTGTGWPMGGPWITADDAAEGVVLRKYQVEGNKTIDLKIDVSGLECLEAVGPKGQTMDLKQAVKDKMLAWEAPPGAWTLYAVGQKGTGQAVKRSAPGDEGKVLDPYSTEAMDKFLEPFTRAFETFKAPLPRAQFHDSFEYYGANWTKNFFDEFAKRRGYDLRTKLESFFGDGDPDMAARVRFDYRATIAELHQAYVEKWTQWSHTHGSLTREQAHGSPTNLEDAYATADIPETEGSFGGVTGADQQLPMMQFASSAAHVTGKPLASSETFTWLGEHFQVPLSRLKPTADFFYLAGINHIFFHGIPYSPADVPWPGWLFYASVNLGPEGGVWHDLPAFNAYATRVQSILQSGKPDNDLLLYFPVADFWEKSGKALGAASSTSNTSDTRNGLIEQFSTPGRWMLNTPFHDTAMELWKIGVSFDEVTDHFISLAKTSDGAVLLGGNPYRAILVPPTRYMPADTLKNLIELASGGATILVQGGLPSDVPGLERVALHKKAFQDLVSELHFQDFHGLSRAAVGKGWIVIGTKLGSLLEQTGMPRESMYDMGLRCVRRRQQNGTDYYIVNSGDKTVDGWVNLEKPAMSAVILDPLSPDHSGAAALRHGDHGDQIYLQLRPSESRIVRARSIGSEARRQWNYEKPATGSPQSVTGTWLVHFTEGGPVLPKDFESNQLGSWTKQADPEGKRFSGTAVYRVAFNFDPGTSGDWRLDLGRVCESARVRLNGKDVTTLWCEPFAADVGTFLVKGQNILEVEVTNVAANRIADLDRRHVQWKNFYEINFVNHEYQPFDASDWPVRDSGLLGPVTLQPLESIHPQ